MHRILAMILLLGSPLFAADVSTLTGKKYSGTITGIADGVVTVRTSAGPIGIPVKEMAVVDFGAKPIEYEKLKFDEVELIDGSLLRVSGIKIPGRTVEVTPLVVNGVSAPQVTLQLDSVFFWCRNAQEPKNKADWKELLAGRGKRDLYVIRNPDGKLIGAPGTVLKGNVTGEEIEFERETGGAIDKMRLARTTGGLVFNQPPRGVIPPTLCKLVDRFGNVLIVQSLAVAGESIEVKTVSGAVVKYATSAGISKLDFSTGNVIYLSEMNSTESAPPAAMIVGEPVWKIVKDTWPDTVQFKLRDATFTRGLALPPEFSLTYKLNADFRELKTTVGVDDRYRELDWGARLIIEADGKPVFNDVVKRTDKARELTLDVKNVKLLTIRVEPESTSARTFILLADARLQK